MPRRKDAGFTLIELLLVVSIIALLATFAMFGQRNNQQKSRDVRRVTDVNGIQKALSLYLSKAGTYPVYDGCLNGTDPVNTVLVENKYIENNGRIIDPLTPNDPASCYFYQSTGSTYSLRYTLEQTSTAGDAGNHLIVP